MLAHIRLLARNRGILLVRILIEARRESLGRRKIGEVRSEGGGRLEGGGKGREKGNGGDYECRGNAGSFRVPRPDNSLVREVTQSDCIPRRRMYF